MPRSKSRSSSNSRDYKSKTLLRDRSREKEKYKRRSRSASRSRKHSSRSKYASPRRSSSRRRSRSSGKHKSSKHKYYKKKKSRSRSRDYEKRRKRRSRSRDKYSSSRRSTSSSSSYSTKSSSKTEASSKSDSPIIVSKRESPKLPNRIKIVTQTSTKNELKFSSVDVLGAEQIKSEAIDQINSEDFIPKSFSSTKKLPDNIKINLKSETISVPLVEIKKKDELEDTLFHPSLYGDDNARMEKWVRKLYTYRQKMITET